jgi:hypothetical protein
MKSLKAAALIALAIVTVLPLQGCIPFAVGYWLAEQDQPKKPQTVTTCQPAEAGQPSKCTTTTITP